MKKILLMVILTSFTCSGEILEIKNKPSISEFRIIDDSLNLTKFNISEISKIKYVISLIEYSQDPYNSDEIRTLEDLIPAIALLGKNDNKEIRSIILEYALLTDNIYLKRRAIYLLEKIESRRVDFLFKELYGANYKSEKLETLKNCIDRGDSSVMQFFPPQGEEITLPKK